MIRDPETELVLSIASLWEIAIKASIVRLTLLRPFDELVPDQLARHEIVLSPIDVRHLFQLMHLERHHGDPFDRMLIAQAIAERLPIISGDTAFDAYPVTRMW